MTLTIQGGNIKRIYYVPYLLSNSKYDREFVALLLLLISLLALVFLEWGGGFKRRATLTKVLSKGLSANKIVYFKISYSGMYGREMFMLFRKGPKYFQKS